MASTLFNFSRKLPEPFDKLTSKTVAATSKYGDGTTAALNATMVKAILAYCRCMDGSSPGGTGFIDHRSVAEYNSAAEDIYHLVVYDSSTGSLMAAVYNTNTELFEQYTVSNRARDGAAIAFAMMPFFLKDDEFREKFEQYAAMHRDGYPDLDEATNAMAILCDNAYRRTKDDTNPAHVKVNVPSTGNILLLRKGQLDAGSLEPKDVLVGEFTIFANATAVPVYTAKTVISNTDLVGKYRLNPARVFTDREMALIPDLPDWYITPEEVLNVCGHALNTSTKATPMRNFLFRGPSGTGKTWGSRAVAAGLWTPYMKHTCSAGSETSDFVGQVFPEVTAADITELREEKNALQLMGGITDANIITMLRLPEDMDIRYDPEGSYRLITGVAKENVNDVDCMQVRQNFINQKKAQLQHLETLADNVGQKFTYIETDFVKALKRGYLIEIQEPSAIIQPGVLVGLNSMLEQDGGITLPTGEIIQRHPDAVVIITTNIEYEGCRTMNQSVTDRMNLILDIDLPTPEVMAERAMAVTGCDDDVLVSRMVQVVNDISGYCQDNGVTDGSCGMRSLIDWINSTEYTGNAYSSALMTVISKATADPQDRGTLISALLEPIFPPMSRAA